MTNTIVELLCQRTSSARLSEPAPTSDVLEKVFQTAFRAPDHKMLHPWRYLVIEDVARERLGEIFVEAAKRQESGRGATLPDVKADKLRAMPLRAPMLIVGIASPVDHPKVPEQEQILSCAVGVGYMLVALQSLGFGGIWRTGEMAQDDYVKEKLGLAGAESIVGFLYVGTPVGEARIPEPLSLSDYVTHWQG